ncbi:hypothetical protein HDV06_005614 [Boothiomyces sp. JEL0866]|nr:hypothetical protein HDV06_005614 [Boothiomyces sp. JEL0866]
MTLDQLDSCFRALDNAETDEDILVALTILPRVLQPTDTANIKNAFAHIPWKFIHRMMISPITDGLMQTIAVRIWTSFCCPEFSKKSKLLKRIKPASQLLQSLLDLEIKKIIMHSLIDLVQENEALSYYEPAVFENINSQACVFPELYLHFVQSAIQFVEPGQFIAPLSLILHRDSKLKFQTIPTLIGIFTHPMLDKKVGHSGLPVLKSSIKSILASKLTKDISEKVLILVSLITTHYKDFIHPNTFSTLDNSLEDLTIGEKKTLSDTQLLVMTTHLAGAEARVVLDSTTTDLKSDELEALPLYYSLLENIIGFLVSDKCMLDESILKSIQKALFETFISIAAFLSDRWDMYQESLDIKMIDNLATVFSLKTYSYFTAEESSVSTDEVSRLVPLVIFVLEHKLESIEENAVDYLDGILNIITADPLVLEDFNSLNGYIPVINQFVEGKCIRKNVIGILMNFVVSSDLKVIAVEPLQKLQDKLEELIKEERDLYYKSMLMLTYLFVTRSSDKLQSSANFPAKEIASYICQRKLVTEEAVELWYLSVSGKPNLTIALSELVHIGSLKRFLDQILDLKASLINSEEKQVLDKLIHNICNT